VDTTGQQGDVMKGKLAAATAVMATVGLATTAAALPAATAGTPVVTAQGSAAED